MVSQKQRKKVAKKWTPEDLYVEGSPLRTQSQNLETEICPWAYIGNLNDHVITRLDELSKYVIYLSICFKCVNKII